MKFYTQKIAVIGLVAVFLSLAGWFCMNPQGMQMMEDMGVHYMEKTYDVLHSTLNACAVNDCLSKLPQVVVAKKFNIDLGVGFLGEVFDNQTHRLLADSSERADFSKTRPPVPDTLSSVFKKE